MKTWKPIQAAKSDEKALVEHLRISVGHVAEGPILEMSVRESPTTVYIKKNYIKPSVASETLHELRFNWQVRYREVIWPDHYRSSSLLAAALASARISG